MSIKYNVWEESQCETVVNATFKILSDTGCAVQNEKGRKLLADAGCTVEGDIVKIPADLMRQAIADAPSSITIYDRNGEEAMVLEGNNTYFGPPITTVYTLDIETGEKRRGTRKDAENAALLCDALPNIHWASALAGISDGIPEMTDLYEVQALLKNTTKPIMYWATGTEHLKKEFEMFELVTNGAEALKKKPFTIGLVCPMGPLTHTEDGVDQLLYLAEKEAPVVYIAGGNLGGTSPINLAGHIIVELADTLVGLLISQLAKKGTPFIASKFSDNLDMRTVTISHSGPESVAANAASADIFHYLNLPFCLNLGDTDSGRLDQNAVLDITAQMYTGELSGTHMNMSIGGFESGNLSCPTAMLFGNDAIDYIRCIAAGVPTDEESLSLASIEKVGPGGNFLMEPETFTKCRAFWTPKYIAPRHYEAWAEDGKKDTFDRLHERAKEIIAAGPGSPLDPEIRNKIDEIITETEAIYKK